MVDFDIVSIRKCQQIYDLRGDEISPTPVLVYHLHDMADIFYEFHPKWGEYDSESACRILYQYYSDVNGFVYSCRHKNNLVQIKPFGRRRYKIGSDRLLTADEKTTRVYQKNIDMRKVREVVSEYLRRNPQYDNLKVSDIPEPTSPLDDFIDNEVPLTSEPIYRD